MSTPAAARTPIDAIRLPAARLRGNDLAGFARVALPPPLLAQVEAAWRQGRTRWPLDTLPLDHKLPQLLATLAADGAQARLRREFDRQFAGQAAELESAATTLGAFGVQYLDHQPQLEPDRRAHYTALVLALSQWAAAAPLAERRRAHAAIAKLTAAARRVGLHSEDDFANHGMHDALTRLGPFATALKQVLGDYGLDLDDSLERIRLTVHSHTGDKARVRMRYPIAGRPIEVFVDVEQVDGRWYISAFLNSAAASATTAPPAS